MRNFKIKRILCPEEKAQQLKAHSAKSDNMSSTPGTKIVERENGLTQVTPCPLDCVMCFYNHKNK